jgi:VWFA-related protein
MEGSLKKIFKTFAFLCLVLVILFTQPENVVAQNSWNISINQISPIETPDSMTLKVYFSIYESHTGVPVMNAEFANAQVALLNTNNISGATIKKPDIPIYVTLVMDSSGSMGGSSAILKSAAKLSLDDIPDDSLFSVIQFDESVKLLQDFTENVSAVSYAIDSYQVSNKGTCIYDAAYTAIESMAKLPTGRRAIILFTDGKDEKSDGSVCSQHKYQELVDLAMKNQVPLNTIGLSTKEANINSVELQAMAASTGGFSSIASKDDLTASFRRIMDALKAQWMVEATIYPKSGSNSAVLTVTTKDGQTLNSAFSVDSNTDYPGPPSPVTASFDGLLLNAARQSYEVQMGITSPDLVKYVKIEVWDKSGGEKVGEYAFNDPSTANSFFIPTESLTVEKAYELHITAVSKADGTPFVLATDDQEKTSTQITHEFTFDPFSAYPSLEVASIVEQKGDLVMNVSVSNPGLVGGFDGWLVNEETNTQVAGSNFSSPALAGGSGTITIPMKNNGIKNGKYSVVVRVLAKDNAVYTSTTVPGVTYTAPTLTQRIGSALTANRYILFGILGIILVVVIFLMVNSSRQKSISGTPVLQGRLGGNMGKGQKSTGSFLPVSDNEPLPVRRSNNGPAAPPLANPPPVNPPPVFPQPIVPPQVVPVNSAPLHDSTPPVDNSPQFIPPTIVQQEPNPPMKEDDATMVIDSRPRLHPYLTVVRLPTGDTSKSPVLIDTIPFTIGRTEGNFNIQEASISRRHVQITFDAERQIYYLTDIGSRNGTFLNQQLIAPEHPVQLNSGSFIGLGPNVTIRFDLRQ